MVGDEIVSNPNKFIGLAPRTAQNCVLDAVGDSLGCPAPYSRQTPTSPEKPPRCNETPGMSPLRGYMHIIAKYSKRGPLYAVTVNEEVIIQRSAQPFLDAARVLLARGYSGVFQLWDSTRAYPRMQGEIELAAALAVDEAGTPRFRNHRQHWRQAPKTVDDNPQSTSVPPSGREEI